MAHEGEEASWEEISTPRSSISGLEDPGGEDAVVYVSPSSAVGVPTAAINDADFVRLDLSAVTDSFEVQGQTTKMGSDKSSSLLEGKEAVADAAGDAAASEPGAEPGAREMPAAAADAAAPDSDQASGVPDTPSEVDDRCEMELSNPQVLSLEELDLSDLPSSMVGSTEVTERTAWKDVSMLEDDIRYASRALPRVEREWQEYTLNLMLVGAKSCGKTTCVKNLFLSYYKGEDCLTDNDGWETWEEWSRADPKRMLPVVADPETRIRYQYNVHDSPPFDSQQASHTDAVINYIQLRHRQFAARESDLRLPRTAVRAADARIDAVLYFLPPMQPQKSDVESMTEIAKHVSLIPVISKADALTSEEVEDIRRVVRGHMDQQLQVFQFSSEALAHAGVRREVPPFALICSNTVDKAVHRSWPVRRYRWGAVEAFRERDGDLKYLKKLVLEDGLLELKRATEMRYRVMLQNHPQPAPGADSAAQPTAASGSPAPCIDTCAGEAEAAEPPAPCGDSGLSPGGASKRAAAFTEEDFLGAEVLDVEKMKGSSAFRLKLVVPLQRKTLAFRIGQTEGCCLLFFSRRQQPARPTTYDTWKSFIAATNHTVDRVVITTCRDSIFHSELHLSELDSGRQQRLDARPSDAINLAVRFSAPILVSRSLVRDYGKELSAPSA